MYFRKAFHRAALIALVPSAFTISIAAPVAAIAPPEPAVCAFTLGGATPPDNAAGTALAEIYVEPAVPSQECTTTVTATTAITLTTGALAGAVDDNPVTQTVSLSFVPGRLSPVVGVLWHGACTATGGLSDLRTQIGGQIESTPLASVSSCATRGTGNSSLEAAAGLPGPSSVVGIAPKAAGYHLAGADAVVTDEPLGSGANGFVSNSAVVGIAATPGNAGYWLVGQDGGVFTAGTASFHGSEGGHPLNAPVVGIAADPQTGGYWLVGADGGVYSFDAPFYGSTGGMRLNAPVVGIAATPDGGGYWLAAADGGVFSFGDAHFYGAAGSIQLNAPVVGISADPNGGYWLVATDGGVFSYGAPFFGSAGAIRLNAEISGVASTSDGGGYWLVAADGGVFTYGDAHYYGSGVG